MPIHGPAGDAARRMLADELRGGATVRLSVRTDSMSPTLRPGDAILVTRPDTPPLAPGDIVVFEAAGSWTVHRLLAIRPVNGRTLAITAGDKARILDPPSPITAIIGRVSGLERAGERIPMAPAPACGPDVRLLLLSFQDAAGAGNRGLRNGGDDDLVSAADREGLAPLIYYYGKRAPHPDHRRAPHPCPLPEGEGDERGSPLPGGEGEGGGLGRKYMTVLGRNTLFLNRLSEVVESLAGTKLILLKGAYLATAIYPSPGLRQFGDIDLLIRPDDFQNTHRRLTAAGYTLAPGRKAPEGEPVVSPYLNSVSYRDTGNGPTLHVHWCLTNSILPKYTAGHVDMDEIWNRAVPGSGNRLEMCPEHSIIHLAEHAFRHSFDRLILVRDIAEIIMKFEPDINWRLIVDHSVRFGLAAPVYYGLLMVARKTGTAVPPHVLADLKPVTPGISARLFQKLLMHDIRRPELCNLACIGNLPVFRDKARFLWHIFFPPRAVIAHAYGLSDSDVGPMLYLTRLCRGVYAMARYALT